MHGQVSLLLIFLETAIQDRVDGVLEEVAGGPSGSYRGRGRGTTAVSGYCHNCSREGHWESECLKRKADLQKGMSRGHLSFMGLAAKEIMNSDWSIDSAASRHLTAHGTLLEYYTDISATAIPVGNGKDITVIGKGAITLRSTLGTVQLPHVLYLPEIKSNLISIASIVDQGFKMEFTGTGCTVSKQGLEKAIGKRQGNIYFLTGLQETALAGLTHQNNWATEEVWHH